MVSLEINVLDNESYVISLFSKHLTPVELYCFCARYSLFRDKDEVKLLSILREEKRESRESAIKRLQKDGGVRRKRSFSCGDSVICGEPYWHCVRLVKSFKANSCSEVSFLFEKHLIKLPLTDWLFTSYEVPDMAKYAGSLESRRLGSTRGGRQRSCDDSEVIVADEERQTDLWMGAQEEKELLIMRSRLANRARKEIELSETMDALMALSPDNPEEVFNFDVLRSLAEKFKLFSGHWSVYCRRRADENDVPRDVWMKEVAKKADYYWGKILNSFFFGSLQESVATQVQVKQTPDGITVAVSNPESQRIKEPISKADIVDKEVFDVDKAIRESGILCAIKYKLDVFSACNVMHSNQKGLRPTIYKSEYVASKMRSYIMTDYTPGYTPVVSFVNEYYSQPCPNVVAVQQRAFGDRAYRPVNRGGLARGRGRRPVPG